MRNRSCLLGPRDLAVLALTLLPACTSDTTTTSETMTTGEPGTTTADSTGPAPTTAADPDDTTSPSTTAALPTGTDDTGTTADATTDTTATPDTTTTADTTGTTTADATGTTAADTTGAPILCGDGNVDGDEACDDANTSPGDGCSATCELECSALRFLGKDPVAAADPAGLHAASITAAVWFREDDDAPIGSLLGKAGNTAGGHLTYNLSAGAHGVSARLQVAADPDFLDLLAPDIKPDGRWHHLAVTYDAATGEGTLVFDGLAVASGTKGAGLVAVDPALPLLLGAAPIGGDAFESVAVADIADVAIYDRALDTAELVAMQGGVYPDGPLAFFPALEGGGLVSADASGNGHDLVTFDQGWVADGPFCPHTCADGVLDIHESCDDGNVLGDDGCSAECTFECTSLHFIGKSMALAADPASLHATSITAAAWYRGKVTSPYGGILAKQGNTPGGHVTYSLAAGSTGVTARLQTSVDPAFLDLADPTAVADGAWHHLAVTYDATSGDGVLYVDGLAVDGGTQGAGLVAADPTLPFAVGAAPYMGGFEYPSKADITEVIVYDTALSAFEIQDLYMHMPPPGALAYYPTLEGTGTVAADATGNGHDLTVAADGWAAQGPLCGP